MASFHTEINIESAARLNSRFRNLCLNIGQSTTVAIDEVHPEERFKREQQFINELSTLNQHTCYSEFRDDYHRQYFLAHRDKTNCDCGGIYTYDHKARHFKSQKHMNFIS